MIDSIQRDDIKKLAAAEAGLSVSIYLPTHRQGPEIRQDAIRLRNMADRATQLLDEAKIRKGDLHDRIRSLVERVDHKDFWDHQGEGLALFFREDSEQMFRLPSTVREHAYVGEEYLIRPLLPQRHVDRPYMLVALTWDGGHLYEVGTESIQEQKTGQFPFAQSDLVRPRDTEEQIQFSHHRSAGVGAAGSPMVEYHGHGEGEHKIEADRQHYLLWAVERVEEMRKRYSGPLILMATDEVIGHLPERASGLFDATVKGSPANASAADLLKRTRSVANELLETDEASRLDDLGTLLSNDRGSKDPTEILNASFDGRIQTLFLDSNQVLVGSYDFGSRKLSDEQTIQAGSASDGQPFALQAVEGSSRDLSNLATIQTFLGDGEVIATDGKINTPLAAIFRY